MSDEVCIKTFSTRMEAQIAKGLLENAGVKCYIKAGDVGGIYPFPFSSQIGAQLFILKKDKKMATLILKKV